jgi:hypothetical protein
MIKVPRDHPRRCKNRSECPYMSVDGSDGCELHSSAIIENSKEIKSFKMYNLAKWNNRLNELDGHEEVKSLRGEIGILRLTLETTINKCRDETELFLYSSKIGEIISRIERIVVSCHRLEEKTGVLLDKTAVLTFASIAIKIIAEHIEDPDVLDTISTSLIQAVNEVSSKAALGSDS